MTSSFRALHISSSLYVINLGHILNCPLKFQVWETRRNPRGEEATYQGSSEETKRSEGAHWQREVEGEERMERGGGRRLQCFGLQQFSLWAPRCLHVPHCSTTYPTIDADTALHRVCVCVCTRGQERHSGTDSLSFSSNNAVLCPSSSLCHRSFFSLWRC